VNLTPEVLCKWNSFRPSNTAQLEGGIYVKQLNLVREVSWKLETSSNCTIASQFLNSSNSSLVDYLLPSSCQSITDLASANTLLKIGEKCKMHTWNQFWLLETLMYWNTSTLLAEYSSQIRGFWGHSEPGVWWHKNIRPSRRSVFAIKVLWTMGRPWAPAPKIANFVYFEVCGIMQKL